jgi:hypothetical protein
MFETPHSTYCSVVLISTLTYVLVSKGLFTRKLGYGLLVTYIFFALLVTFIAFADAYFI